MSGVWQYLTPWFIYLAQGSGCNALGQGLSQPISSQGKHPNILSSKCLHCILPCVSVPADWNFTRYLGDATEGKGKHCELSANIWWIQTGRCSGPGPANRRMTLGLPRGWNSASENNLCLLLVFDLNWLSLNQKQWPVQLSWKLLLTSSTFGRDHFDTFSIPTNINLWSIRVCVCVWTLRSW